MKPLIGITPMYDYDKRISCVKFGYQEGIINAGGIPVIIPFTVDNKVLKEIFNKIDGILLSGGPDVDPKHFGEETLTQTGEISPERDEMEIFLAEMAMEYNKPTIGICRGCQVLNIAGGGDIFQDIYKETDTNIKHCQTAPKWYGSHTIEIEEGSIHQKIFGQREIRVNSFHHQAVKNLGREFTATAKSSDNIIEAIEHNKCSFCVGVQYHPELLWEKERVFLGLFRELVNTVKNLYL